LLSAGKANHRAFVEKLQRQLGSIITKVVGLWIEELPERK